MDVALRKNIDGQANGRCGQTQNRDGMEDVALKVSSYLAEARRKRRRKWRSGGLTDAHGEEVTEKEPDTRQG